MEKDVLWIRAILNKKKEIRVSNTTGKDSLKYNLTLEAVEALSLSRVGTLSSELLSRNEVYNTTEKVFNHLTEGEEIWAAVMPHDTAVYFVLDETGTLFPV